MPYIKKISTSFFEGPIKELAARIWTTGELNYVLSKITASYLENEYDSDLPLNYAKRAEIYGTLCAFVQEYHTRVLAPYEALKRKDLNNIDPYEEFDPSE